MFSKAKVGDKVWSFRWGFGIIEYVTYGDFPIGVQFDNDKTKNTATYTTNGKYRRDEAQDLFWDEVKFEIPKQPKRKVKKYIALTKTPLGFGMMIKSSYRTYVASLFNSEKEAFASDPFVIKAVEVEFEE